MFAGNAVLAIPIAWIALSSGWLEKRDKQHGTLPMVIDSPVALVRAVLLVANLFFTWGFIYGLLDVMNSHVREALNLSGPEGAILAVTYYLAYLYGPLLISGPMVKRCGYRVTFLFGLLMVAIGCFLFAFAATKKSMPLLAFAMHVSGHGVSALERAANPYITNCGPKSYRTSSILFSQSMAGVGTVIAAVAARMALYGNETETAPGVRPDLGKTIQLYKIVGCVTLGMLVVYAIIFFGTIWVPEIPVERSPAAKCSWKFWKHPLVSLQHSRLWFGAFSNFFNMACQVTVAQFFIDYLRLSGHQTVAWATNYLSVAQGLFVIGRLMAFGLVSVPRVKPRYVLLAYISVAVATVFTCAFVTGKAAIVFACLIMLSEAPFFPMIFDAATVGLGDWAATGETIMITSICGGAIGPPIFGALKDIPSVGVSKAWLLVAGFFGLVWMFPFLTNVISSWRKAVDLVEEATDLEVLLAEIASKNAHEAEVEVEPRRSSS